MESVFSLKQRSGGLRTTLGIPLPSLTDLLWPAAAASLWIIRGVDETFERLKELVMKEQFLLICSRELFIFLSENKLEGKGKLLQLVKTFTDDHCSFGKSEIPEDRIRSNPGPAPRPASKFEYRKYQTPKFPPRPFPTFVPVSFVTGLGT